MSVTNLFEQDRATAAYGAEVGRAVDELHEALAVVEAPAARWRELLAVLHRAQHPLPGGHVVDLTARAAYDEVFDLMARLASRVDPFLVWDENSPA